jgi:hypothetical protein
MWLLWHLLAILFVQHVIVTCGVLEDSDLGTREFNVLGERNAPISAQAFSVCLLWYNSRIRGQGR